MRNQVLFCFKYACLILYKSRTGSVAFWATDPTAFCLCYRRYYFASHPPQLPEQPAQFPEHLAPSGQPMHLIPFFLDLWIYHTTRPTITRITAATRISINFIGNSLSRFANTALSPCALHPAPCRHIFLTSPLFRTL